MEIDVIQVGSFEVNCSVLSQDGRGWIVDPGADAEAIFALLDRKGLVPSGILLTHAHFDHIGAIPDLLRKYPELEVFIDAGDVPVLTHPLNHYPPEYLPIERPTKLCSPEDCRLPFEVIRTPGHTPGGVCYYFKGDDLLLSGDTLFAGSFGRTDLPGGDFAKLTDSLRRLCTLPEKTRVLPGHGPWTTIGAERRNLTSMNLI